MSELKSEYDSSPETGYLDELIADTSSLIASVYDILEQPRRTPQAPATPLLGRRSHNNSDNSRQLGGSNSNSPNSPKTPRLCVTNRTTVSTPSSQDIDREINRIDRFCEMLEHNLRSVSVEQDQHAEEPLEPTVAGSPVQGAVNRSPRNTPPRAAAQMSNATRSPTPDVVIDLSDSTYIPEPIRYSNTFNISDDVIIVTPSVEEIVDLCTPTYHRNNVRPRSHYCNSRQPNFDTNINDATNDNGTRQRLIASRRLSATSSARPILRRTFSTVQPFQGVQASTDASTSSCCISTTTLTTNIATAREHVNAKNKNRASEGTGAHSDNSNASVTSYNGRAPFMCAVCMESSINNQPTSTKCGHVFCSNCIRQALRLTRKCPMCNTKLTPSMLFRIYV